MAENGVAHPPPFAETEANGHSTSEERAAKRPRVDDPAESQEAGAATEKVSIEARGKPVTEDGTKAAADQIGSDDRRSHVAPVKKE